MELLRVVREKLDRLAVEKGELESDRGYELTIAAVSTGCADPGQEQKLTD